MKLTALICMGSVPVAGLIGYLIGNRMENKRLKGLKKVITEEIEAKKKDCLLDEATKKLAIYAAQEELAKLTKCYENYKAMLCSPQVCKLLCQIAATPNYKIILEMGVFTGTTTLDLALAVGEHGRVIACGENNILRIAKEYFEKAEVLGRVIAINSLDRVIADLQNLRDLDIDMAIIYANVENPSRFYKQLLMKLKVGGIIAIDGMFPIRKLVAKEEKIAPERKALLDEMLTDSGISVAMVHIGKGLVIAVKL